MVAFQRTGTFLCCVITATQYFLCFWICWWVTAKVIISLTHQKGWRREKGRHPSAIFPQKGKPWYYTVDVGIKWLRHRMETGPPPSQTIFLYVLREPWPPPLSRSSRLFNPVTKTVSSTWGAEGKFTIVCDDEHVPKQRGFWVCFEHIITVWWLTRKFFILFLSFCLTENTFFWTLTSLRFLSAELSRPRLCQFSHGSHWVTLRDEEKIPHPHPNIIIAAVIASKNLHSFPPTSTKPFAKRKSKHASQHQEPICMTNGFHQCGLCGRSNFILFISKNENSGLDDTPRIRLNVHVWCCAGTKKNKKRERCF